MKNEGRSFIPEGFISQVANGEDGHDWKNTVDAAKRLHDHIQSTQKLASSTAKFALKQQEELKQEISTDQLTGLLNKHGLKQEYDKLASSENRRSADIFSMHQVLFVDLDHFGMVNKKLQHAGGDELLRQIGGLLKSHLRETDIAGRFGGDEFIVMLTNTDHLDAVLKAEELRQSIFELDGDGQYTASIGVAPINPQLPFEEMYELANKAMYEAKENGRNQVVPWGVAA